MTQGRGKIIRIVQKLILAITLLFCVFILIGTVYTGEKRLLTDLFTPPVRIILLLLMAATVCLFLVFFYRLIDRLTHAQLIGVSVILFLVMAAIFAVLICNFQIIPFTDALNIQDTAIYLAKSGTKKLTESAPHYRYYQTYGNNNLLTILLSWFYTFTLHLGIKDTILPSNILAASGIMISALLTFLTGVRIGDLRGGTKVLTLCVINPLYYLLVFWVYTNVISIPFMIAVLYFGICAWQAKVEWKRILYSILTVLSALIGCYIRATVLIPFIAILCCGLLLLIKRPKDFISRFRKSFVIALLAGVLLYGGIKVLNNSYFAEVSQSNFPVTHWLMMGSHGDGMHNDEDISYTASFDTKAQKREATLNRAIENYKSFNFFTLAKFLGKKMIRNWCYGDGQDLFNKIAQNTKPSRLNSWVLGDNNGLLRLYCYAFWLSTFFLVILSLLRMLTSREVQGASFVFSLAFFGGVLFYLFWEVKSTYSLPFLPILFLLAEKGGEICESKTLLICKRMHAKSRNAVLVVTTICLLAVCSVNFYQMTHTTLNYREWSIRTAKNFQSAIRISRDKNEELIQEFYTSIPFNTITLGAKADQDTLDENVEYQIQLENEKGEILYTGEIHAEDISDSDKISIHLGKIIPDGNEKYRILIEKNDAYENYFQFMEFTNSYLDIYPGTLTLNGNEQTNDLWMRVYEKGSAPWTSTGTGLLINAGWFAVLFSLLFWLLRISPEKRKARCQPKDQL